MRGHLNRIWLAGVSVMVLGCVQLAAQEVVPAKQDDTAELTLPPLPDVELFLPAVEIAAKAPVEKTVAAAMPVLDLPQLPDVVVAVELEAPARVRVETVAAPAPAPVEPLPVPAAPAPVAQVAAEPRAPDPKAADTLKAALAEMSKAPLQAGPVAPAAAAQRKEREQIADFYATRNFAPLWLANGKWTPAALAVLARVERAGDDGLDLKATPAPAVPREAAQEAAAELALTQAAVAYGRQASGGRVDPQRISILITVKPETADSARVLSALANSGPDAGRVLQAFNPPHKGYEALRIKLAEVRQAQQPVARERIPAGAILRVGMRDPRVPLIRARFGLDTAQASEPADITYDTRIAAVIADFQRANGLPASGILTARTIAALSGGEPARLENEILANMERWRWLPRDLGREHVEVNIPDYTVRVYDGERLRYSSRVVVGKPDTPTPVFSNSMQFLIVNPYWSVPQSIIKKEMMPRLAADPDYLRRLGYEVVRRNGVTTVRQPPGERNALGRIKFMFPNDHAVYLHDTPSRALFANEKRAFSHGCVRVDQPFKLAEIVLGPDWNEGRLRSLIGGPERTIHMPRALPIHIEYFTAGVDDGGRLQLRDDIYGYSRRLKLALGLED